MGPLLAVVALAIAACGDTGGSGGGGGGEQATFKRPVNLIVPFSPGSGSDRAGGSSRRCSRRR